MRHFGDVSPTNLSCGKKAKTNATKACIHRSRETTTSQNKHKKTKAILVTIYDIQPGNGAGLFSKERDK